MTTKLVQLVWDMEREKEFIDGLGRHRKENTVPRLILLSRYLDSCIKRRIDWEGLEKGEVIRYIKESIENEGGMI